MLGDVMGNESFEYFMFQILLAIAIVLTLVILKNLWELIVILDSKLVKIWKKLNYLMKKHKKFKV